MSTTVLAIYNAALSEARGRGRLTSLTENSREREICDTWYALVRDQVQEAAFWPACRQTVRPALLASRGSLAWTSGDPETDFRFSFALPGNYLRAWHLDDYSRFSLSFDSTRDRLVLNCNTSDPVLVYAARNENPVHWTAGQKMATIYALSASISGQLSGSSQAVQINFSKANEFLTAAQMASLNSRTNNVESTPPVLTARGYEGGNLSRFYYPFGQLFPEAQR